VNPFMIIYCDAIEKQLRELGYCYPPEAVRAVLDGEEVYYPSGSKIFYLVTYDTKRAVQEAQTVCVHLP
jgi:hypothetical protein